MSGTQATISSFFSPSPKKIRKQSTSNAPIDLTLSDDDESQPPRKRQRTASPTRGSPNLGLSSATSSIQKYTYTQNEDYERTPSTSLRRVTQKAPKPKKKLLQANNPLLRKPSRSALPTDTNMDVPPPSRPSDPSSSKGKKHTEPPSSRPSYTPLEFQVLHLRSQNPGTVLMVEVGYKYKFYQDDAMIAHKELGMACFPDRNFHVASVPVHRKEIHLQKLLACGYRVGICSQTETAALKKIGTNKNTPFQREVTELYTAATYVNALDGPDNDMATSCILSLVEHTKGKDSVSFSLVAIDPSTGHVTWDVFDDTHPRLELETRLAYLCSTSAVDIVYDGKSTTGNLLRHFASKSKTIRIEGIDTPCSSAEAFRLVTDFVTNSHRSKEKGLFSALSDLPDACYPPLSHLITYLDKFGLSAALLDTRFFRNFRSRTHMMLASNTLNNLEILQNSTDGSSVGSLFSILNRTKTRFGTRLLREWLSKPLVDHDMLRGRLDAVEELVTSNSSGVVLLQQSLDRMPDLARGIGRISYCQATCQEFSTVILGFEKLGKLFHHVDDTLFNSPLLNSITSAFRPIHDIVTQIKATFNLEKGSEGDMATIWRDPNKYPVIEETLTEMRKIKNELLEELKLIRKILKRPSLEYTEVGDEEYLIELKKTDIQFVPDPWIVASKTRYLVRYHTPNVLKSMAHLAQLSETLVASCRTAFHDFLKEVTRTHYHSLRDSVNRLAEVDCLVSFAQISLSNQYVRPSFSEEDQVCLIDGRHPVQEAIHAQPQVLNSLNLGSHSGRHKVLTGPNMAGKSSFVRMVAIICLMAQCGCFVPAKSLTLKPLDMILTRMGASDDIVRGRSTFAIEMEETSAILSSASKSSLVILDELGRGTSTFDGVAIAQATLEHLVSHVGCKTIFITHYPSVGQLEQDYPREVTNLHMAYQAQSSADGSQDINFLYQVTPGIAGGSFGIECARMAGLPSSLLATAQSQSLRIQQISNMREQKYRTRNVMRLLQDTLKTSSSTSLAQLQNMHI